MTIEGMAQPAPASPLADPPTVPAGRVLRPWKELYTDYADFLWRSVRRMGLSGQDAEDALHEAFIIAERRHGSFDPSRGTERAWLFGIAANVVRAERRRHRPVSGWTAEFAESVQQTAQHVTVGQASSHFADGQGCADRGNLRQALRAAMQELDPERRAVFAMFELEGFSCGEIAEELGVPVGTVYSRLHKARALLQATLADYRRSSAQDEKKGAER